MHKRPTKNVANHYFRAPTKRYAAYVCRGRNRALRAAGLKQRRTLSEGSSTGYDTLAPSLPVPQHGLPLWGYSCVPPSQRAFPAIKRGWAWHYLM